MYKSLAVIVAVMAVLASPCVAKQPKSKKSPQPTPVVSKYDNMQKEQLQAELKKLQKEVLVAERTAKQAKDRASEASRAYESASDNDKPDALLRMLEAEARSRRPLDDYSRLRLDLDAAKRAYLKLFLAEQ